MPENKKVETVNKVHAVGRVKTTGWNEYGYSTVTLTIAGERTATIDFALESVSTPIRRNQMLEIDGYIRGFSYYDRIRKGPRHVQYCVAETVKATESELEKEFHVGNGGGFGADPTFRFKFMGTVQNVSVRENSPWFNVTVRTDAHGTDRRPCDIRLSCNRTWFPRLDLNLVRGDVICGIVTCSTNDREREDGSITRFENFVIRDISVVERVPRRENAEAPRRRRFSEATDEVRGEDIAVLDIDGEPVTETGAPNGVAAKTAGASSEAAVDSAPAAEPAEVEFVQTPVAEEAAAGEEAASKAPVSAVGDAPEAAAPADGESAEAEEEAGFVYDDDDDMSPLG